ncbi:MAG: hypothetical protein H7146_12635 [Burkholderiaceae bacterium]|nr:hypothetical protein [Microbacteriaceae bacterium]
MLTLPDDRSIVVESNALIGGIEFADAAGGRGGFIFHDAHRANPGDSTGTTRIRVWTLIGSVSVQSAGTGGRD